MFSTTCEYGIRAIIYIAQQSQQNKRVSIKEIAKAIDSPVAFTAKVVQSLAKDDLVVSVKGAGGGYEFPENSSSSIKLGDVVKSIDGDQIYKKCGLGLEQCSEHYPCPVHKQFKAIRDRLVDMMQTTTIHQLATKLELENVFLKQ